MTYGDLMDALEHKRVELFDTYRLAWSDGFHRERHVIIKMRDERTTSLDVLAAWEVVEDAAFGIGHWRRIDRARGGDDAKALVEEMMNEFLVKDAAKRLGAAHVGRGDL